MDLGLADTGRETKLRRAGALEDDELGLEEDVAVDGEADASVRLDTTEAGCRRVISIYDKKTL